MPGHAPLITELTIGEIAYKHGGKTEHLSVAWGFAEVLPDKVTILAQTAERAQDIDVKRAAGSQGPRRRSSEEPDADLDYEATLNALKRAEVRLKVAQYANAVTSRYNFRTTKRRMPPAAFVGIQTSARRMTPSGAFFSGA